MPEDWAEYRALIAELTPRQRVLLSLRSGVKPPNLLFPKEWEEARIIDALGRLAGMDGHGA